MYHWERIYHSPGTVKGIASNVAKSVHISSHQVVNAIYSQYEAIDCIYFLRVRATLRVVMGQEIAIIKLSDHALLIAHEIPPKRC